MSRFAQLAFTENVRRTQEEHGSAGAAARLVTDDGPDLLTSSEAAHIESRDGFYLASVGEDGWPYLQYRGGPPGFVHVLDERTLAFADVRGNRQYITTGNVRGNDRVALFFMDYPHRTRLKLLGHATALAPDERPELAAELESRRTDGRVERLLTVRVEGVNWNCPQHITPRFSEDELRGVLRPFEARLGQLEEENRRLRAELAARA
ncbi:pyridoxamine 5'-phosphate oxidase family protein [Streptomyces sp. NPDC056149]|uniref:pyridoxamine 5'-phosphate oxidase family protein n=1 Tax=Streptomyces sp. NPDC056149 TaxID=3345728 RepID=UPI0035DEE1C6